LVTTLSAFIIGVEMAAQSSGGPSTDIVDLWKRSEELVKISAVKSPQAIAPASSSQLSTERSAIWTNLSQLSPADQATIMSRLAATWPYAKERRALNWPVHAGIIANCLTSAAICTKINADMVLYNAKTPFLEAVKKAPKAPFVFGIYSSGVTFFVMHQIFISPSIFGEARPCSSCLMSTAAAVALTSGVAVPMLSTPYLAYYILLQRSTDKFPPMKSMMDVMTLCWEGSRAARPLLPAVVAFQVAVATAATYAALWGRSRLFDTLDSDVELARDLMVGAQSQMGMKEKVLDWIAKVPLLGGVVKETPPEQERIKV
ncbi:hypothetical protein PFISCL1PPCAC_23194, partial [Pristionchus fissidentatus]